MFLHTWYPQPILLQLGGLEIHWYGFFLAVGALAGFFVIRWLAQAYRIDERHITNLFTLLLVFGLIGARLWHVSNEWAYYRLHPDEIIAIWNGGLGIHGAVLSGLAVVAIYSTVKKLNFWLMADVLVPGLVLGQAIGRWGNYFNQELFGRPTTWPWGIPIDAANRPDGFEQSQFFHPTFLYESIGSLVIFFILVYYHRRRRRILQEQNAMAKLDLEGALAILYFILYSILRISTESLRLDHTPIIAGIRLPIITSGVLIIGAVITWFILRSRLKKAYTEPWIRF